ncbi:MAG: hypothetical protein L0219_01125 [Phycisphaerales bacterium]|nr:hypothetical protein [Phycisphaerales bacterium]
MPQFTQQIFACLLTFALLVQATFGRSDSLLCLGHLHSGSCSVAIENGRSHSDDCDHAEGIDASLEQQHDSNQCCCLDVQLTAQQSTQNKRIDLVDGFQKAAAADQPPAWFAAPRSMQMALRLDARDGPAPRDDRRARSVILQI